MAPRKHRRNRDTLRGPMPAPKVDRALVLRVAKLASLSLSEAEADSLAGELERIVAYVAQLEEPDTQTVPPTAHIRLDHAPWREDVLEPCLTRDEALAAA